MASTNPGGSGHEHRSGGIGGTARLGVSPPIPPRSTTSPRHQLLLTVGCTAPSTTGMVLNLTDTPLGVAVPCLLASVVLGVCAFRHLPKNPLGAQHWRLTPRRWCFGPEKWRLGLPSKATFRPRATRSGTPPRGRK